MFEWIKTFFTGVFGSFWGNMTAWFMKILIGPAVFFIFGPLFELSGHVAQAMLARIQPELDKVGLSFDGIGAWLIEVLRIQECVSMYLTFLILGFTVSLFKRFIS